MVSEAKTYNRDSKVHACPHAEPWVTLAHEVRGDPSYAGLASFAAYLNGVSNGTARSMHGGCVGLAALGDRSVLVALAAAHNRRRGGRNNTGEKRSRSPRIARV